MQRGREAVGLRVGKRLRGEEIGGRASEPSHSPIFPICQDSHSPYIYIYTCVDHLWEHAARSEYERVRAREASL